MTSIRTKRFIAALGLCATLLLVGGLVAGGAQAGDITYEIALDTSLFAGTSGYLDFQLNPGDPPVDQATATISGFTSDGTLGPVLLPDLGDVSGSLPGSVVINNTDLPNEYTQAFTIGTFFDVFVELDIPNVSGNATGGNTFTLDLQDSGFNSLFGTFPALEIDLDATTGNATVTDNTGGAASVAQTPEPATFALLGIGLVLMEWWNRARVGRAAQALNT